MKGTFRGALIFGAGLFGMLDGIIFHQLLQWHSTYMYTNRFNQIVSDGMFHILTTTLIVIGTVILWKCQGERKNEIFWSGLLIGSGLFNVIESLINHRLLQVHHVLPGSPNQDLYDLVFELVSIAFIVLGWAIFRHQKYSV